MTVAVPDESRDLPEGPEGDASPEIRVRLAAHFYSVGTLSAGRAAELSGLRRGEFEAWLKQHGVQMPWTEEDLRAEVARVREAE